MRLAQFPDQIQPFAGTASGELLPTLQTIANILLGLVGIAAVIFIALAGIRYISSGGDPQDQTKAKNQIIYAVIGLIVIGLSAAVVNFTINAIQGRSQFQQQNLFQGIESGIKNSTR